MAIADCEKRRAVDHESCSCPPTERKRVHQIDFQLPFAECVLHGDSYAMGCHTIVLHGAGNSSRTRFERLRQALNSRGIPSVSFDFIGHGDTGGSLLNSSLHERTDQASAVIRYACAAPLTLIGASMSGYTAIKLTEQFVVDNLILLVPAVYNSQAYDLAFGFGFSEAIRVPGSWQNSDAFSILSEFRGNLLIIAAEFDDVIPVEVVEKIHASAKNAEVKFLHIVTGSKHLSLFPREQDFLAAIDLIVDVCRGGRGKNGLHSETKPSRRNIGAAHSQ